jgi:UDP-galactopyranose mutase
MNNFDIVIVGAGISGCVLAERYANKLNKKVLIIEKRDHIGGNCYDYYDNFDILVPKYGPHFFHTNNKKVFKYVSQFTDWKEYKHKSSSMVDGKLIPMPVNINSVNLLFNLDLRNKEEMILWLEKNRVKLDHPPKNSEELALSRYGKKIYEKLYKYYIKKQWGKWPSELDPLVMNRIPIRTNFEDHYFSDRYQVMPSNGFTRIFQNMLKNKRVEIQLNQDYFKFDKHISKPEKIFFTGRVDDYYRKDTKIRLQYRSIKFKFRSFKKEFYQSSAQINYPDYKTKFTRITEPKYSTGQKNQYTTIIKEYPQWRGEPLYPIPDKINTTKFLKLKNKVKESEKKGVYFIGRLAEYKYINMDQAFDNALNLFEKLEQR